MKLKIVILTVLFIAAFKGVYSAKHPHKNMATKHMLPAGIKNGVYKFTGNLNGKIPIFLWLLVKDSVLKGEVTYLKTAKRTPITVIGTLKKNDFSFYEFAKSGVMTGYYEGEFKGGAMIGHWYKPGTEKELSLLLNPKDTLIRGIDTQLTSLAIAGEYTFAFGKEGSSGGLDIKIVQPGVATVEINSVTGAPSYNVAQVDAFKAPIVNNTITYKLPGTECKFRIRLYNGFVMVDLLSDISPCGWGLNASVDGIFYKKTE